MTWIFQIFQVDDKLEFVAPPLSDKVREHLLILCDELKIMGWMSGWVAG